MEKFLKGLLKFQKEVFSKKKEKSCLRRCPGSKSQECSL
jgi:hypothetical protein